MENSKRKCPRNFMEIMKCYNKIISLAAALIMAPVVSASADSIPDSTSHKIHGEISAIFRGAYVLPSNPIVRGENAFGKRISASAAADIRYSFRMPASSRYRRWYPYAYQGAGIGVSRFFDGKFCGTPVNVYVLQGSRITSFSERLSLNYEWNFGASFGWKKISSDDPFDYTDVDGLGSHLNAYINLGISLDYRLNDQVTLIAGVDFSHYSNGNTSYPNPGINVLWGKFGFRYELGKDRIEPKSPDWSDFTPHVVYDVMAFGAWKKASIRPGPTRLISYPGISEWPVSASIRCTDSIPCSAQASPLTCNTTREPTSVRIMWRSRCTTILISTAPHSSTEAWPD